MKELQLTVLDPSAGYFILINTFTVEPGKPGQQPRPDQAAHGVVG